MRGTVEKFREGIAIKQIYVVMISREITAWKDKQRLAVTKTMQEHNR